MKNIKLLNLWFVFLNINSKLQAKTATNSDYSAPCFVSHLADNQQGLVSKQQED